MAFHFQLDLDFSSRGYCIATLSGALDGDQAEELSSGFTAGIEAIATAGGVLIDLRGLTICTLIARTILVEVEVGLASAGCRVAWLADRPLTRGLALWIVNLSGSPTAASVESPQAAEEWLKTTNFGGPMDSIPSMVRPRRDWRAS